MFKVEKKRWQNFLCLAFRSKAGKFQPMRDYFHPPIHSTMFAVATSHRKEADCFTPHWQSLSETFRAN